MPRKKTETKSEDKVLSLRELHNEMLIKVRKKYEDKPDKKLGDVLINLEMMKNEVIEIEKI